MFLFYFCKRLNRPHLLINNMRKITF
jgi:photosystem II stability/assembly factor-like uncharacterized protein